MRLTTFETDQDQVVAGYSCPCGCTPSATYGRGDAVEQRSCCCGNEFAIGPGAERSLASREGFTLEVEERTAGWGAPVSAAWLIGPSVHPEPAGGVSGHDHAGSGHDHGHDATGHRGEGGGDDAESAIDPVCGMRVDRAEATERGLHRSHAGSDYFFCAKGCYLDFGDDPERYLDPAYIPSM